MSAHRTPPPEPPRPDLISLPRLGLETLLAQGTVRVIVASAFEVGVPQRVREKGTAYALDIAHEMSPPIGLQVHDAGFSATLSFGSERCYVVIPYAAILAASLVGSKLTAPPAKTRSNHLTLVP